jgi:TonB-dependent receptor
LRSGYREDAMKHELLLESLDGSYTANPGGGYSVSKAKIYQYFVDRSETVTTSLITSGGHFMLGNKLKVDIQGGWTKGTDYQPKEYEEKFVDKANLTYNVNDPSQPSYSVTSPGVSLADPTQFTLSKIADKASLNFDQEYSARINLTLPLVFFGTDGEAKIGGAARLRNNGVDNWETDANVPKNAPSLSQFVTGNNNSFAGYNLGSEINIDQVNNAVTSYTQSTDTVNQAWSRDSENVYAGYAQYTAKLDRLSVVGGVRIEATDATQLANLDNAVTDVYTPNKTKQDYVNLFPSVQGKYQMTQDLQLRAAFSTGIARPGFQQITASTTVNDDAQTVTTGNPNLKPMIADNYDIGASYDLPQSGSAGLGLFYKSFSDYVVQTGYLAPYQGQPAYTYTTFQNIASARAVGVEVNVYKPFTFLPSPYDGFGLIANYTYVNSAAALRPAEKADEMPGTSPENANVELSYDKGPISARIGMAYKSANLFIIGATRDFDQFAAARLQLDLGASYQLDKHFQIYFSAKNLTNSPLIYTQGQSSANQIQHEYYDATYYSGIRASF